MLQHDDREDGEGFAHDVARAASCLIGAGLWLVFCAVVVWAAWFAWGA